MKNRKTYLKSQLKKRQEAYATRRAYATRLEVAYYAFFLQTKGFPLNKAAALQVERFVANLMGEAGATLPTFEEAFEAVKGIKFH